MSQLITVAKHSDVHLQKGWVDKYVYQSLVSHNGREYKIIAKHILPYSDNERVGLVFLALLATIVTLGLALISSKLRGYFKSDFKASKVFAMPHKVFEPKQPDPSGKLYPQDLSAYERLTTNMDPEAIKTAIDEISDHSINKEEIIKCMLFKVLTKKLPQDLQGQKVDIAVRCQVVQVLIASGVDLNVDKIGIYKDIRAGIILNENVLHFPLARPGQSSNEVYFIKPIQSFMDTLIEAIFAHVGWNGQYASIPKPAAYMPVVNVCKPLINLLLTHGAEVNCEENNFTHIGVERKALFVNLRQELKFVQHILPGVYDPGSSLSSLPKEVVHLIGQAALVLVNDFS